jgi:hypothetical protein
MEMTVEKLRAAYPELIQAIEKSALDKGKAEGLDAGRKEGFASGAEAERKRIVELRAVKSLGHDEIIGAAIEDGKTTAAEAAVKILAAADSDREKALGDMKKDTKDTPKVPAAASEAGDSKEKKEDFEGAVAKVMEEKNISRAKAIKIVANEKPELHQAWLDKINSGKEE